METMEIDPNSRTHNEPAVYNRLMLARRLRDILMDELDVTDKVQVAEWTDDQWEALAKVDFDRRQAVKPTKSKFKAPSEFTVAAVRSLLPPVEGIMVEGSGTGDHDPFDGLQS